jgi:NNP family nitrate/nitrite transporter-like MFS transporter
MVAYGWHTVAQVWAVVLIIMSLLFWVFTKDEPQIREQRAAKAAPKSMLESLKPLKKLQVWRFSLYYFFVFGGFVALALWLPRYYVGVYGMDIKQAGMLAASFSVAGSLFRAVGGVSFRQVWGTRCYVLDIFCLYGVLLPSRLSLN